jgi:Ca2+-binding RTX toxin-like protein
LLLGGPGDEELNGRGGDDFLSGHEGQDVIDGGPGDLDMVGILFPTKGMTADLGAGTLRGQGQDSVSGVEAVEGTEFADEIVGNDVSDLLRGNAGDDVIFGNAGDDLLTGGDGTDTIDGGLGTDDCFEAEAVMNCENDAEPIDHPLSEDVTSVREFLKRHR